VEFSYTVRSIWISARRLSPGLASKAGLVYSAETRVMLQWDIVALNSPKVSRLAMPGSMGAESRHEKVARVKLSSVGKL
jgi:hypothetical protein